MHIMSTLTQSTRTIHIYITVYTCMSGITPLFIHIKEKSETRSLQTQGHTDDSRVCITTVGDLRAPRTLLFFYSPRSCTTLELKTIPQK